MERRRGWVAVGGVFVVLAISTGLGFYGISAFVSALARERGFSLSVASLGPTLSFLASGLGGVAAARLLPRTGVRPALLIGAAGTAAGLVGLAYATTAWAAWLSFVLIGGVGAFMAVVPCTSLITRWFEPNPARALTIATTGMSAGGALVSPLVVLFIDRYGLRVAAEMLAVATVVIVAVVGAVVREPAVTLSPRSGVAATGPEPGPDRPPWTFAVLCVAFSLMLLSQSGTVAHLVTIAGDRGIGGAGVALIVVAVASVFGRLGGIPVLAGVGLLRFSCGVAAVQATAMALTASAHSLGVLLLAAALLGVTVGNVIVLMPLHMLAAFSLPRFDRAYARLNLATTIGGATSPVLLGVLHDRLGGYGVPVALLAAGSAVAGLLLYVARIDTARAWRARPSVATA